ncbi:hypothetical protein [Komagataeibacter diospyri]|uniref:Uncharacterized protein n=1 Tax=Komagataeibacter diospyri TaxID=1932662 RepID=A0A4P5NXK9_9PROT|nr:hypothetical protein [Komagataeibacter diospyri]GCE82646.1 hypothetical protein MSKU9_0787 [Komagataeibacter diospyri]
MKHEHIFLPMPRNLLHGNIWVDREFGPYLVQYVNSLSRYAAGAVMDTCPHRAADMVYGPYALDLNEYKVPDAQRKADHGMFDRYFGIARVNMDVSPIDMLGASCIIVMSAFLGIKQAEWLYNTDQSRSIIDGMYTVLKWVLSYHDHDMEQPYHDIFQRISTASSQLGPGSERNNISPPLILNRWKIGHQIFFILIQGILLCCRNISSEPDLKKVNTLARDLQYVLVASRFAMEFAGDMLPADYISVVRPHMSQMSPSFSGLFLEDHAVMLIEFKKVNQRIGADDRSGLVSIISELYEAHASVCEHVMGKNKQSLMSARHKSDTLSAAHDLRNKWLKRATSRFDPPDKPASCPF